MQSLFAYRYFTRIIDVPGHLHDPCNGNGVNRQRLNWRVSSALSGRQLQCDPIHLVRVHRAAVTEESTDLQRLGPHTEAAAIAGSSSPD
jgi:hypothetical protein